MYRVVNISNSIYIYRILFTYSQDDMGTNDCCVNVDENENWSAPSNFTRKNYGRNVFG